MKESKYNVIVNVNDINNKKSVLYNTLTRKYLEIHNSDISYLEELLKTLNKDKFDLREAEYIRKMIKIGAVIEDNLDEVNKISFLYNKYKFNEDKFTLVVEPTLNCNFRCVYCYEDHRNEILNNEVSSEIINLVKEKSKNIKKLRVIWFGGEPMLEFERIVNLTKEFKNICNENNCEYESGMTSNGYLFNDENISMLEDLCVKNIQITLDGTKDYHDKNRPLANGEGTFNRIRENCIKLLDKNIILKLRINIDENNYMAIPDLLDSIPEKYKNSVKIQFFNIFQNKQIINCYDLYKQATDKGYPYSYNSNTLINCEGGSPNSITVKPNGKVSFCPMAGEKGYLFGALKNNNIKIENKSLYFNFHSVSPFNDKLCFECKELPMCMGACVLAKLKQPDICLLKENSSLTLEEKIKLHYYNDLKLHRSEY